MPGPVRDAALLDAIEGLDRAPFSGPVWRSVRDGRDPTGCGRAGGRWDDRTFDVLYTSLARDGAIEERRLHLFRGQPIPPSRVRYTLFELTVRLAAVVTFADLAALQSVGMVTARYGALSWAGKDAEYPPSQAIAEACFFLGADGILVPNARHESLNLIVFCDQDTEPEIDIVRDHGVIEWA